MSLGRLRSRSGDIFVIVVLLVISAVVARNFARAPSAPSPQMVALQVDLQKALEGYYETNAVTVRVTPVETSVAEVRAEVKLKGWPRPGAWAYRLVRFVAQRHAGVKLNKVAVFEDGTEVRDIMNWTQPTGKATMKDYEEFQAQAFRNLAQQEADRIAGPSNSLVLVHVTAAPTRHQDTRKRSRIRARAPEPESFQVARLDVYVVCLSDPRKKTNLPDKIQQAVQGSIDFNKERGDTYKLQLLEL